MSEKTESLNSKIFKTKTGRIIVQSKHNVSGIQKIVKDLLKRKKQKDYKVFCELKHHLLKLHCQVIFCFNCKKMGEIVNTFLMVADKSIPEMHFKQPEFTYSACGPFTKTKKELEKLCRQEIEVLITKINMMKLDKILRGRII